VSNIGSGYGWMDGWMDQPNDGSTDEASYGDASKNLKTENIFFKNKVKAMNSTFSFSVFWQHPGRRLVGWSVGWYISH
jgi:hypothetical protein